MHSLSDPKLDNVFPQLLMHLKAELAKYVLYLPPSLRDGAQESLDLYLNHVNIPQIKHVIRQTCSEYCTAKEALEIIENWGKLGDWKYAQGENLREFFRDNIQGLGEKRLSIIGVSYPVMLTALCNSPDAFQAYTKVYGDAKWTNKCVQQARALVKPWYIGPYVIEEAPENLISLW